MTEHPTLAAALAAMQAQLPRIRKTETAKVTGDAKNGGKVSYSYGYAGLDEVVETVLPALGEHGLSVTAKTAISEIAGFVLEVKLMHTSGESEMGVWMLPDPRRAGAQEIGSAMTYGRRYLTLSLTGTFPGGEDDDGAKAQASHVRGGISPEEFENLPRERPQRQQQQNAPTSPAAPPAKKVWTDDEVLEQHAKLDSLELDKAGSLYDWMASRDLHVRKVGTLTEEGVEPVNATTRLAIRLATIALAEDTSIENLSWIREFADGRGLLKTQVSPKSNLDQWLAEQRKIRTDVELAKSETAQAMRSAAADSWDDDKHPQPTPEQDGSDPS